MEYQLLGVSGLILIILGLTWLKDGEKMDPPLKKRILIDIVTIGIFWAVFEFYNYSNSRTYENEIALVVNGYGASRGTQVGQIVVGNAWDARTSWANVNFIYSLN